MKEERMKKIFHSIYSLKKLKLKEGSYKLFFRRDIFTTNNYFLNNLHIFLGYKFILHQTFRRFKCNLSVIFRLQREVI